MYVLLSVGLCLSAYVTFSFSWGLCNVVLLLVKALSIVAQSVTCLATDASLTADPGVGSLIPARSHTFAEIDHEIISTVILLPSAVFVCVTKKTQTVNGSAANLLCQRQVQQHEHNLSITGACSGTYLYW